MHCRFCDAANIRSDRIPGQRFDFDPRTACFGYPPDASGERGASIARGRRHRRRDCASPRASHAASRRYRRMTAPIDSASVQLLHLLGHLDGQHGETKRGLVLLLIAARLAPDNVEIWRTLAHSFLADGARPVGVRPSRRGTPLVSRFSLTPRPVMTLDDTLTRALVVASRRTDLTVATLVLVAIVMMIVPLPTPVVDMLITANIAASVLILLVAFYIAEPLELSSLPSLILIATLFRLAMIAS